MSDYKDSVIEAMKERLEELIETTQKETGFSREKILCDLISAIEYPIANDGCLSCDHVRFDKRFKNYYCSNPGKCVYYNMPIKESFDKEQGK